MHKQYVGLIVALGCTVGALASASKAYAQDDVHSRSAQSVALSRSGGLSTTVLSIQLPAGQWVLSSTVTLVNFGPSDYTRCQLFSNDIQIGSAATMVGSPSYPGSQGDAPYVATLGITAAFSSDVDAAVALRCGHDHDTPSPHDPGYVDPGANVWAHQSA